MRDGWVRKREGEAEVKTMETLKRNTAMLKRERERAEQREEWKGGDAEEASTEMALEYRRGVSG